MREKYILKILKQAQEETGKYLIDGNFIEEHYKYALMKGRYDGIKRCVALVEDILEKDKDKDDDEF